jgi:hypothetical protein
MVHDERSRARAWRAFTLVVAFDHNSAAEALGISPTRLRQHVRPGEVVVHFSETKPIYLIADLEQLVEQLPTRPNRLPRL